MEEAAAKRQKLEAAAAAGAAAAKALAARPPPLAAASGASPPPPQQLSFTALLEAESVDSHSGYISKWASDMKAFVDRALIDFLQKRSSQVHFRVPSSPMLIPPLKINAASGATSLSAFREVMNFQNMTTSFNRTRQYEAAGTIWMLDPISDSDDMISISQLEGAMWTWSEDAFRMSSTNSATRRFSFDVPLPAKIDDIQTAQKNCDSGVLMAKPLAMLAGHAIVIAWYGAIGDALRTLSGDGNDAAAAERVFKLFEAALSVPIRMRLNCDFDECQLASLMFSEVVFAATAASGADSFWKFAEKVARLREFQKATSQSLSGAKTLAVLKTYGLTFRGKAITDAIVKALKSLAPFVVDPACRLAYAKLESVCPELRESTLLMRIAQLSSGRMTSEEDTQSANASLLFIFESLFVARLTGDFSDTFTVKTVTGQEKKSPALVHMLFKKFDLIDFISHEAAMIDSKLMDKVSMFKSPMAVMKHFSASGEESVVAEFRKQGSASGEGLESMFALAVAKHCDDSGSDPRVQPLIDIMWGAWSGVFNAEFEDLATQDLNGKTGFLWHRYFTDSSHEMSNKYRAFLAACQAGPISAPGEAAGPIVMGTSDLSEQDKLEVKKLKDVLLSLRRKSVNFTALPAVGGATGVEFSSAQLQKAWEGMRLGHKYSSRKSDVRAFILSADLFPPNLAKATSGGRLTDQIPVDSERMKRVIDFILQKRTKDDIVLLFDGRSRQCRKVIELAEEKLAASGAHAVAECWYVYLTHEKKDDPRVPGRQTSFIGNNKEVSYCSLPKRGVSKLVQRAEFNTCGENSTASTTYTGIPMRRYCELPRMDHETKASVLGSAAAGAVTGRGLQRDINEKGHPFSHFEVKPLTLWQRICEHHKITHIVDFSVGSAALAIVSCGAMEYEGIAANDAHREWLDSTVDRCVIYQAGKDKQYTQKLGGDADFVESVHKYFAGTMMEARKILEPVKDDDDDSAASSDCSGADDQETTTT